MIHQSLKKNNTLNHPVEQSDSGLSSSSTGNRKLSPSPTQQGDLSESTSSDMDPASSSSNISVTTTTTSSSSANPPSSLASSRIMKPVSSEENLSKKNSSEFETKEEKKDNIFIQLVNFLAHHETQPDEKKSDDIRVEDLETKIAVDLNSVH